jgi:LPXTG-site transpeptidase (sortase) family protein
MKLNRIFKSSQTWFGQYRLTTTLAAGKAAYLKEHWLRYSLIVGLAIAFLIAGGTSVALFMGISAWFSFEAKDQSQAIRIALVAPLNSSAVSAEPQNSGQQVLVATPTPTIIPNISATLEDSDPSPILPELGLSAQTLISPWIGVATWLAFQPEDQSRLIKIALIAPLRAPATLATAENSAPLAPAANPDQTIDVTSTAPPATSTPTPAPTMTPTPTPTISPTPTATPEDVATKLVIPKLSLNAPILFSPVENGTWEVAHLDQAVGYLEGTAPFGSKSNAVLAGHVTLAPGVSGPFARLDQLAPGDLIVVVDNDEQFLYMVENLQTVNRSAVQVTYPSNRGQLTLITCTNWNSDEGRYNDRMVVKGRLIQG